MSKTVPQMSRGQMREFNRHTTREAIRLIHLGLLKRFEDTHDFPLNYEKPEIDNSPASTIPLRIFPRPCRGAKRAYLRRRAREIVCVG